MKGNRLLILLLGLLISCGASASALQKKTVCIWDPVGLSGPVYSFFFDLKVKALAWGVDADMRVFENEQQVARELLAKNCDVGIVTAVLARHFVPFAGSLDAIGGITSDEQLKHLLFALNFPHIQGQLAQDDYEVVAVLPVGSMYAFVNDRNIRGVEDFKNKRIAMLNGDVQVEMLAQLAQAKAVDTTLNDFARLFTKGDVDIVLMPALAYNAFELYQALGKTGGVLDMRIFNGMLQGIVRREEFDSGFGFLMRAYIHSRFNDIANIIQTAEKKIPDHYWIRTEPGLRQSLTDLLKDTRLQLKIANKLDPQALSLLWEIRCEVDPQRHECKMP